MNWTDVVNVTFANNTAFNTTVPAPPSPSATDLYRSAVRIWFTVTCIVGFAGAFFIAVLLCAMAFGSQTRGGANVLIVHLLCVELFMCSALVPHQAFSIYFPFARIGRTGCRYNYLIWMLTMSSSQWLTCALAVNRVIATMAPHCYHKTASSSAIRATIVLCWLIPCATFFPYFFETGGYYDSLLPWNSCSIRTLLPWATLTMYTVGFYIPMALMGACYALILVYVVWKMLHRTQQNPGQDVFANAERQRLSIAKMLMASALWYYLCYLPNTIMATSFYSIYVQYPPLQLWLRTVFFLGYVGNPLIFFAMCKDYRNGLLTFWSNLKTWFCCLPLRPTRVSDKPMRSTSLIIGPAPSKESKDAQFVGVYCA